MYYGQQRKGIKVYQLLIVVVLLGLLCCGGCSGIVALFGDNTYSEGERTGPITKFSNKGLMWKTWEGEMNLGGVRNGPDNNLQANIWEFSVTDPELVTQIQEAQRKGGNYTVQYRQVVASKPWVAGTTYIVTKITPVTEPK